MAVSKRLRYEILARDNHTCRYCGATAPDVKLVIDHVTPTALGGRDEPSNLVTACEPCNSGKTSTVPGAATVEDIAEDALRWAAAIKQAAAELEAQDEPKRQYQAAFKKAWDEWTWEYKGKRQTFDLDPEWRSSLERFRQASLPVTVWPDIVEKAMTHKTVRSENIFRYCCGIAWRMVTELQDAAKRIVAEADRAPEPAPQASPTPDQRQMVPVFLGLLWNWAWDRAGHDPVTEEQKSAVFNQCWDWAHDGTSGRYDLFDVVFDAGTDGSTDLADYLPDADDKPAPLTDEDYERGYGVIVVWEDKWQSMSEDGSRPSHEQAATFAGHLVDAIRAGHERDWLLNAADLAGGFQDTNLPRYLPRLP